MSRSCDTIWKCFMKQVWTRPDSPFLGMREVLNVNQMSLQKDSLGEYKWLTFKQVDEIVDSFSKSMITRDLCPLIKSNVEGTPDMKFIGIFSENRQEWFITELAACSDSIVTVPISVQ